MFYILIKVLLPRPVVFLLLISKSLPTISEFQAAYFPLPMSSVQSKGSVKKHSFSESSLLFIQCFYTVVTPLQKHPTIYNQRHTYPQKRCSAQFKKNQVCSLNLYLALSFARHSGTRYKVNYLYAKLCKLLTSIC